MSKTRWIPAIAAAGLMLLALAPRAGAQTLKHEPITPISGVAGADSFSAYCAVCHGAGAKGNGPAAKALKTAPPDLTLLAARNQGKFPALVVKMTVLGDQANPAHGSKEMPIWGTLFRSVDSPAVTDLRVGNIVKYLESIQAKQ